MPAKLCLPLALALVAALAVLAVRPDLDLAAARAFYAGHGRFVGDTRAGLVVRSVAWALPFLLYLGCLARYGLARARRRRPGGRAMLFLTLGLALGPGLVVHATLKELSHRPRPYRIAAFGGIDAFRPFDRFDGACRHNCSFPSGETAAATWTLAPASLVPPPWRGAALGAAAAFAAATGVARLSVGAHFPSDVCGGALATLLVTWALRRLVIGKQGVAADPDAAASSCAAPASDVDRRATDVV